MSEVVDDTYEVDIVGKIREDLQDRYQDHYAILKELIQNADDAKASELHLVFIEHLAGAEHELLQGPLLAVINNAAFKFKDAAAIRQLQGGSKGLDDCKIGKFGLGQKSVFHLCEAFFFVSDLAGDEEQIPDNAKRYPRSGIRSPWGRSRYASRLKVSDSDLNRFRVVATQFLPPDTQSWFALFLPLRLKRHCIQNLSEKPDDFAIKEEYHDDLVDLPPTKMFGHNVVRDLLRVLPFMSTLNAVSHWRVDRTGAKIHYSKVWREVEQHVDWRRMTFGRRIHTGQIHVTFSDSEQVQSLRYAGCQELLNEPILRNVPNEEGWPRFDMQTVTGRQRGKAAAKQHVGVVVLEHQGAGQFLGFVDSVFLPLGAATHQPTIIDGNVDFEVLLHGFFFLDSGRKAIDRRLPNRPADEETTRQKWNRLLLEHGVLPLMIPAFQAYADGLGQKERADGRIKLLTKSVLAEKVVYDHLPIICKSYTWGYYVSDDGFSWTTGASSLPLIELPAFNATSEGSESEMLVVFPALEGGSGKYTITISGYPRLSVETAEIPQDFVCDLLRSVPLSDVAGNRTRWDYLTKCIKTWKAVLGQEAREVLVALAKQYFRSIDVDDKATVDEIKALLDTLPDDLILPVSINMPLSKIDKQLLDSIWDADAELIAIPSELLKGTYASKLTLEKVETLIKHLMDGSARLTTESGVVSLQTGFDSLEVAQATETLALNILSALRTDVAKRRDRFESLHLWNVRAGTLFKCVCLKELGVFASEHRLFKSEPDAEATEYLKCFSDVTQSPIFLNTTTATTLQKLGWLPTISCFDAIGFVTLLQGRPSLHDDMVTRGKCARRLGRNVLEQDLPVSDTLGLAIRYLLHGSKDDTDVTRPLFLYNSDGWSALAAAILDAKGEGWRVIGTELADFGPSILQKLVIGESRAETVIQLLDGNTDFNKIACRPITDSAAKLRQLLQDWPLDDFGLLRKLRMFQRSCDQKLISAEGPCLIQGPLSTQAAEVFKQYSFINDQTGMLAFRKIIRSAVPEELLLEALDQSEPHKNWRFILDSLHGDVING
jgi:hypothetical protein